jgi:hypothetical protein
MTHETERTIMLVHPLIYESTMMIADTNHPMFLYYDVRYHVYSAIGKRIIIITMHNT